MDTPKDPISDGKTVTEPELIRRSKGGSREAFGQLVSRYQVPVYRVVRGILGSPSESEDVAQEVFLKAYANLAKFRVPEVEAPQPPPAEEDAPTLATLEKLLRKLSDEFRSIVVLRDIEGMSYSDIAETLEIPIGTVESRLFRARQELRTLWRKSKEAKNAL
jgi:RNA polymerase sigma-70 factor, ECF subfamily